MGVDVRLIPRRESVERLQEPVNRERDRQCGDEPESAGQRPRVAEAAADPEREQREDEEDPGDSREQ